MLNDIGEELEDVKVTLIPSIVISELFIVIGDDSGIVAANRKARRTVAPTGFWTWTTPEALFVPIPSVERLMNPFSDINGLRAEGAALAPSNIGISNKLGNGVFTKG